MNECVGVETQVNMWELFMASEIINKNELLFITNCYNCKKKVKR